MGGDFICRAFIGVHGDKGSYTLCTQAFVRSLHGNSPSVLALDSGFRDELGFTDSA